MKVVLFHKNCHDGLFAAFSYWKKFGSKDTIFIEVNYKPIQDMEPMEALNYIFNGYIKNPSTLNPVNYEFKDNKVSIEDMSEMELFVVDYSFPVKHLEQYIDLFKKILVLDHHKTAIDEYTNYYPSKEGGFGWTFIHPHDNCDIVFSHSESGAKLAWMYFHGGYNEVPDYIELISDYDLWKFNLENTRKFDYGLKLQDITSFNVLDVLMNSFKNDIINVGGKYERMHLVRIEKLVKSNIIEVSLVIGGVQYKCGLVNAYPDVRNEVCDYAIKTLGYDAIISYNIYSSTEVSCSLRSKLDLDSSNLSKMYGGGGHKNSSAFRISMKEFNNIIKNKYILVTTKPNFGFITKLLRMIKWPLLGLFRA